MISPVLPSDIPNKPIQTAAIIRRAGAEDMESACDEVRRLVEACSKAAIWSVAAYRAYFARETAEDSLQTKALFLACAPTEPVESSVISGPSARAAWERIVGFAVFSAVTGMGECSLENMAVAKPWRKQGIGSRLLSSGLLWCRAHSGCGVWLEVRASNRDAIALYERAGFSIAGSRPDYYSGPTEAAIQMKKDLGFPRGRC